MTLSGSFLIIQALHILFSRLTWIELKLCTHPLTSLETLLTKGASALNLNFSNSVMWHTESNESRYRNNYTIIVVICHVYISYCTNIHPQSRFRFSHLSWVILNGLFFDHLCDSKVTGCKVKLNS